MICNLDPKDLILSPESAAEKAHKIFGQYGFQDCARAYRNLQNLAGGVPFRKAFAEIVENVLKAFAAALGPDVALNNFQ